MDVVRNKKSLGIVDCVTVLWISSLVSGGVSLLLWPQWSQTQVAFCLCAAVGGWQLIYSLKGIADSTSSKVVVAFSCQVVSAGFIPDKTSFETMTESLEGSVTRSERPYQCSLWSITLQMYAISNYKDTNGTYLFIIYFVVKRVKTKLLLATLNIVLRGLISVSWPLEKSCYNNPDCFFTTFYVSEEKVSRKHTTQLNNKYCSIFTLLFTKLLYILYLAFLSSIEICNTCFITHKCSCKQIEGFL